jgi:hypothetical protein
VHLSWSVTGSAAITVSPPIAGAPNGAVEASGQATIAPTANTRVELHVTRFLGAPTASIQDIDVKTASDAPEPLTASLADASAGCGDGKVWATVHAQRFSPDVKVATVASHAGDDRTYDVQHAGRNAKVTPGAPTASLAGSALVGDWVLTSPLRPGETCGTPTLPRSLVVDVFTQCVPGSGP